MRWLAAILLAAGLGGCGAALPESWFGAYRLADGRLVSVRESTPESLRLRIYDDGLSRRYERGDDGQWRGGSTPEPDALSDTTLTVEQATLIVTQPDGSTLTGERLALPQRQAFIDANGERLFALLTLPTGEGRHPAVIVAHGSGDDAATRTYPMADFFPPNGIATLIYDKRGTGQSSGTFTQDFVLLADDLVGAAAWLATQDGIDASHIGVSGYSQGGWIGPLAAARGDNLSYVVANYGMVDSPRVEARVEAEDRFRHLGYDAAVVAEVGELADASIDAMASGYRDWARFDATAERFQDRTWMNDLDYPVSDFLRWPHWAVRVVAPWVSEPGLRWDYNSMDALDSLAQRGIPSAWLIASDDSSAPNAFTLAEIERRAARGEPVSLHVFEHTDHGFLRYVENADGSRQYLNYHPDAYRTQVGYVRRYVGL